MAYTAESRADSSSRAIPGQRSSLPLEALRAAARGLDGIAARTPLVEIAELSSRVALPVSLKCEQLQPVGAFKIRGAFTAVSRIPPADRARGVITYSSGNHGQAVA